VWRNCEQDTQDQDTQDQDTRRSGHAAIRTRSEQDRDHAASRERDTQRAGQGARASDRGVVSVPAFERLARDRRARIAMGDEVRHARMMTELAAQFGGTPRAIEVPALPIRALDEIGRENAAEGCVREAYGALVATYQGETAAPALREVFRAIARDEREHAALAEDVDRWIGERLDATAREDLMNARASARIDVRASLVSTAACETLGIPGGARAVALFDAYFA
jgi:bacterioferritin (cytochrome b1)